MHKGIENLAHAETQRQKSLIDFCLCFDCLLPMFYGLYLSDKCSLQAAILPAIQPNNSSAFSIIQFSIATGTATKW